MACVMSYMSKVGMNKEEMLRKMRGRGSWRHLERLSSFTFIYRSLFWYTPSSAD